MTTTARPYTLAETSALLIAFALMLLSAFLVIRALEGRPTLALDMDEVKVLGDESFRPPVFHRDAAPVECDSKSLSAGEKCEAGLRRVSY